jgi:predicted dehydrogenase
MQLINISGSKGYLTLDDFVLPYFGNQLEFQTNSARFNQDGCNFHMERHSRIHKIDEYSDSKPDAQEIKLFRNFSALVNRGEVDSFWPEVALKTQRLLNACLESARNGGKEVAP